MKTTKANILLPILTVLLAGILYGCATEPTQIQSVENARADFQKASQNKDVKENATVSLYEAEKQLQKLNNAVDSGADKAEIDHLAYLVQQRVAIAKATAEQKMAVDQIDQLSKERTQILMSRRQADLQRAEKKAETAAMEAKQEQERAASLQQQLQKIQAANMREEARGTVLTLGDVFFDFNKATLKPRALQNLDSLVQFLKENPQRNIVVEGYTDSMGSAVYNQKLSYQRAQSVIDYLESQGINSDRLTARGYGEAFPVATNEDPGGRQLNRRVEVVVLHNGQQPTAASGPQQQTDQEVKRFSEMDQDKNGYLSKQEAQQTRALGSNFNKFDKNHDDRLSKSEFAAFEDMEIQHQQKQRQEGTQ
jgi:OOP family OmpA-OmpF porin